MVWFSEVDLRVAAGPGSFARGRGLVEAVAGLERTAEGARAVVRGSRPYEVFLGPASPGLFGECACPHGSAGNFCRHCVAVGLVLLGEREPGAAAGAGLPQITLLQRRLDATLLVRGAVDQEAALSYARMAGEFLDTVTGLVDSGHAAEARPLARRSVERITDSLLLIDDEAGAVGAQCQRALALYARACAAARPNPVKLAGWLFQLELHSPGWPAIDLAEFAAPLGDGGLAAYRELVDEAWDNRATGEADIRRALTLLVMRERLAAHAAHAAGAGDPEALADAGPENLPSPAAFLGLANGDRASWLADFLVQAYLDGGRGNDALELRRSRLSALPSREGYAKLRETARALDRWTEVRPWALDVLCASGDALVGALLDDGEPDAAWEAAEKYGCATDPWLAVARLRAARHPADVLAGFRALVLDRAARTGRRAYREAAGFLRELRDAALRCGELADFDEFTATLRARYLRKPALLDELNSAGLG